MSEVYFEQRMIHSNTSLAKDLARHLFTRGQQGRVAIVTDNPPGLHAALRKQWTMLLRQVQRERSSTLQAARILVLSDQISWMQRASFTRNTPDRQHADVYVLRPAEWEHLETAPTFSALYITDDGTPLKRLAARMKQGIVVSYHTPIGPHC